MACDHLSPEEGRASESLRSHRTPLLEIGSDSIPRFYPDTHGCLHSVDGDIEGMSLLESCKRRQQRAQEGRPAKMALDGSASASTTLIEMFEFLKSERFNLFFSFLLGLALMSLLKPVCGEDCKQVRAAPLEEVKATTYQIGQKCYQFKTETVDCPKGAAAGKGVIETFRAMF